MIHSRSRDQRGCTQQPVAVDDYGTAVFRGHYTGTLVWADKAAYFGPALPQAPECYVDDAATGKAARLAEFRDFEAWERNCNTCAFLVRRQGLGNKGRGGFLYGDCTNPAQDLASHPYRQHIEQYGYMAFCPEDYQGMPCWQARKPKLEGGK